MKKSVLAAAAALALAAAPVAAEGAKAKASKMSADELRVSTQNMDLDQGALVITLVVLLAVMALTHQAGGKYAKY